MKLFLDRSAYQNAGTAIAANGFFCQQQITNGVFVKPKHIAEILYATMAPLEAT